MRDISDAAEALARARFLEPASTSFKSAVSRLPNSNWRSPIYLSHALTIPFGSMVRNWPMQSPAYTHRFGAWPDRLRIRVLKSAISIWWRCVGHQHRNISCKKETYSDQGK